MDEEDGMLKTGKKKIQSKYQINRAIWDLTSKENNSSNSCSNLQSLHGLLQLRTNRPDLYTLIRKG